MHGIRPGEVWQVDFGLGARVRRLRLFEDPVLAGAHGFSGLPDKWPMPLQGWAVTGL